jgi:hypothetical protein
LLEIEGIADVLRPRGVPAPIADEVIRGHPPSRTFRAVR